MTNWSQVVSDKNFDDMSLEEYAHMFSQRPSFKVKYGLGFRLKRSKLSKYLNNKFPEFESLITPESLKNALNRYSKKLEEMLSSN